MAELITDEMLETYAVVGSYANIATRTRDATRGCSTDGVLPVPTDNRHSTTRGCRE